ncbi:MAG: pyroglutamyl-peptidase I [Pseudolabrys sp.]|nr:pyroglutamyl-peptidase I [Pseudolabrys sp.]MDP2298638.1 pyroglutamyl-peptidase I [Pseudolabrys sp.]
MPTILISGFGPFPGAPYNPTIRLVERLARLRRPALADVRIVGHVFETGYAGVDRDLPALIAKYRPDALLMFGLAARTKYIRIETRARNALALLPDASGAVLRRSVIAPGAPLDRMMPAPQRRLLAAARNAGVPVRLSRDAGRYLCNYLCWRASEVGGPKLAAFVHVPLVKRHPRPTTHSVHSRESGNPVLGALGPRFRGDERRMIVTVEDLFNVGSRLLVTMAAAVNRT